MLKKIINARYAIALIAYAFIGSLLASANERELLLLPLITQGAILSLVVSIGLILTIKCAAKE